MSPEEKTMPRQHSVYKLVKHTGVQDGNVVILLKTGPWSDAICGDVTKATLTYRICNTTSKWTSPHWWCRRSPTVCFASLLRIDFASLTLNTVGYPSLPYKAQNVSFFFLIKNTGKVAPLVPCSLLIVKQAGCTASFLLSWTSTYSCGQCGFGCHLQGCLF